MARVIEPIGLLALLLRRTSATTNNASAITNIPAVRNLRMHSSSSMKPRDLTLKTSSKTHYNRDSILGISRRKSTSNFTLIANVDNVDKKAKQKKAGTIKKLHKANKEMFGELLETQQQKLKRVKKESKKSKAQQLLLEPSYNDFDSSLQTGDESAVKKRSKAPKTIKIKTPKSLPVSEITQVNFLNGFDGCSITASPQDFKALRSNASEMNWAMTNNRKMTKVIGTSFKEKSATAIDRQVGEIPVGLGQGKFVALTGNRNGSLHDESRGACSSGQSSAGPVAGEAELPSLKQFINSQDILPSSEIKVIKKPGKSVRNPTSISKEAIGRDEASSSSLSESFGDVGELDQSQNTSRSKPLATRKSNKIKFDTKGNDVDQNQPLKSKLSPISSPSLTKNPAQQITNRDEIENQSVILQENGNAKTRNHKTSTKTDNNQPQINSKSAKADNSSPILITVPYFNADRPRLAEMTLDSNSCEESVDNSTKNNQIISIPFPRTVYNSFTNSDHPQLTEDRGMSRKLPSVSKILNVTMPKEQAEALERWQAKMIVQLGEDGFRLYKENMLNNGKMLHSNIETYLRGTVPLNEICVAETNLGHWSSLKNIIGQVQGVKVLESRVVHPELKYCGIVDCVALFRNKLVVIDWKTSQKQKPFVSMTYDTPLQIAAYIGAINYDPNYPFKIEDGLIAIAYEDGTVGQTFSLRSVDVAKYWGKWLERLNLFNQMTLSSTASIP